MIKDIKYFFKRKYRQIERVIDYLPVIWKGFDFDYQYSLEMFKKQLERQAKFFDSNYAYNSAAKTNAQKIRTAIRLMDKVYGDEYEMEWIFKFEKQFGSKALDWEFEDIKFKLKETSRSLRKNFATLRGKINSKIRIFVKIIIKKGDSIKFHS